MFYKAVRTLAITRIADISYLKANISLVELCTGLTPLGMRRSDYWSVSVTRTLCIRGLHD